MAEPVHQGPASDGGPLAPRKGGRWDQVDSKGEMSEAVPRNGGGRPALSKGVRAQLDVMWTRESHTVATNWVRAKADYDMTMRHLSVLPESLLPQLGSVEVRDQVGMAEALATLVTSLRPGRNSTNIQ